MPQAIRDVISDVCRLLSWTMSIQFLHVHQMLFYQALAKDWKRLVDFSQRQDSAETRYMLAKAREHNLTTKWHGDALISALLTYEIYKTTPADPAFTKQRAQVISSYQTWQERHGPKALRAWRMTKKRYFVTDAVSTYHRGVGRVVRYVTKTWIAEILLLLPSGTIIWYERSPITDCLSGHR